MSLLRLAAKYLHYFFTSRGPHGIHSPFVYQLVTQVFRDKGSYSGYWAGESIRKKYKGNHTNINVVDFGAGSIYGTRKRTVSDIAGTSAKPPRLCRLLYRICAYHLPEYMLELGTSLGVSTVYQAYGAYSKYRPTQFISLEGSPEIAELARKTLGDYGMPIEVKIITGNFDETLADTLKQFPRLDYVFFDGNHRFQPTMDYFHACLPLAHENTLFIFDDIRWSKEMEQAWEEIKRHPQVTITIDLFFMGLVFFKQGQAKQDFVVRF